MPTLTRAPASLADLADLLSQSPGFDAVSEALDVGHSATIDGAWGSSAAVAVAALARKCSATLVVVLAHPGDLDSWAADLLSFSGIGPQLLPAWDNAPGTTVADDTAGQRLHVLNELTGDDPPRLVLTTFQALVQPVPNREQLANSKRSLRVGDCIDTAELAAWLVARGYQSAEAVEMPGEFSRRGGILDIYSPGEEAPFRLELFGDEVESIRAFSPQSQRSLESLTCAELSGLGGPSSEEGERLPIDLSGHFCDYLPVGSKIALVEPDDLAEQGKHYHERLIDATGLFTVEGVFAQLMRFPSVKVCALPSPGVETACHLRVESVERVSGDINKIKDELDKVAARDRVLIACQSEAECKRLGEVLASGALAQSERLHLVTGRVRAGFRLILTAPLDPITPSPLHPFTPSPHHPFTLASVVVLGGQELFHRDESRTILPRRRIESRAIDSFLDLAEGDLVVHVSHGIARYRGMQLIERNPDGSTRDTATPSKKSHAEEHLILEFRDGVRVFVPASKIDLVQKYVGGAKSDPELSKIGGTAWANKKQRVEEAVRDLAADMLQLQAVRAAQAGIAYPADTEWQREFEGAFPYQETPDQLTTLSELKGDMERPRPMDRLICGDVGYGKTELAIRAAFKAIDNGRQVAVLVPTTVLAEQHYRTFSQRMAEFPFVVHSLNRFRKASEQRAIVAALATGGVDVIIGTHRLLSKDVKFSDLGLVVIDEEQRFGVEHKEKLKLLRSQVDVLTLTATPIPRTLHLSLLGIRDISNLETPPPDRLAIETRIVRFDPQLIRHAILREMNREGQIYFVHNRVHDIEKVAEQLHKIVPEAKLSIIHGQMSERELERGMMRFVRREVDILLATTIIESGLDIPNANTMFINEADHYGLADLHQLRGRVGRYKNRAYCYLLLDGRKQVAPNAAKRLKAMEEFTSLGAGFKIALRDLEIRGAGNILGTQQSGHIASVGYELYCQLLENAVRTLKQLPPKNPLEVIVDLPWAAYLPRDYVEGQKLRVEVYRRLTRVRKMDRLLEFRAELIDRFGAIPEPTEWLLRLQEIRIRAAEWKIADVHLEGPAEGTTDPWYLVMAYRSERKVKALKERDPLVRIVDEKSAYYKVGMGVPEPEALYEVIRRLLGERLSE